MVCILAADLKADVEPSHLPEQHLVDERKENPPFTPNSHWTHVSYKILTLQKLIIASLIKTEAQWNSLISISETLKRARRDVGDKLRLNTRMNISGGQMCEGE